jgi:hypothetical protein
MSLSIEYELVEEVCPHCQQMYSVVRGPVYDNGEGVALYLAGLHRCADQNTVVTTVAWKQDDVPQGFTFQAWANEGGYQMSFIDGDLSPWASHEYLGRMLSAEEARASELRHHVFHVADLVCCTIPEVVTFLDESAEAKQR